MSSTPPPARDELRDTALHEEIELVGQLVVAATATTGRLSREEIDQVLGVEVAAEADRDEPRDTTGDDGHTSG